MKHTHQQQGIAASDTRDAALLADLGYKQEFIRDFSPFEVFGLGFSIIGVVPSVTSVLPYSLPYGGTLAMVWGWAICSIFLMFIALAVAELGSSAPTSGGLYYWTFHFSSPRYRKLLSWIVGYTNSVAYISAAAAIDWGCSVQIMAAVTMGSNLRFVPSPAQIYGVYCTLLVCHALVASGATKIIARLQSVYILVNIALCLAIIIGLPAATPREFKNTAKYALGHFENTLAFSMGTDLPAILESPIGQSVATIFYNSFGRRGTLILWSFIILVQFMMGTSILTAASRQIFAFSRDGALPFARFLYHIDKRTNTPVNCVWACAFSAGLLALICLAGPAASGAIFTLGVICQYVSLSVPIAARYLGGKEFVPGPFHLGKCGKLVAAVAVTWMTFMAIALLFPSVPEADTRSMNYTIVVLGGVLVLSLAYYYCPVYGGVYWFAGPVLTVARDINGARRFLWNMWRSK
ncbi:GABA-specific high-affinity permease [Pleurotus pulmonarius]|nr:GABA-specific high-affinity permease [Pleurotus pulmonarius]